MGKIKKTIRIIRLIFKINWIKTLYINFKTQKFSDAIILPIIVFGKFKINSLKGEIIFNTPIKPGLLQVGKDIDSFPQTYLPCTFNILGNLSINGNVIISGGVNITSWKNSNIILGDKVRIGSGTIIKSINKVTIGEMSRITANCIIMDTDVHFLNESNIVSKNFGEIIIGKYCWLNSGTIISKNSVIQDYVITLRNTFINKDLRIIIDEENILVGGAPVKLIKRNVKRIFSEKEEFFLREFFKNNVNVNKIDISNHEYHDYDESKAFFNLF